MWLIFVVPGAYGSCCVNVVPGTYSCCVIVVHLYGKCGTGA